MSRRTFFWRASEAQSGLFQQLAANWRLPGTGFSFTLKPIGTTAFAGGSDAVEKLSTQMFEYQPGFNFDSGIGGER